MNNRKTKRRIFLILVLTIITLTAFDIEAQTLINVPEDFSTARELR